MLNVLQTKTELEIKIVGKIFRNANVTLTKHYKL